MGRRKPSARARWTAYYVEGDFLHEIRLSSLGSFHASPSRFHASPSSSNDDRFPGAANDQYIAGVVDAMM
jgi:hypothetical protein